MTACPVLELPVGELHRLLKPVLPFAGTDDTLPVLCTVKLEVRGGWLYATATDRFKAVIHRVPIDRGGDDRLEALDRAAGFDVLVGTADLRRILATFPLPRRGLGDFLELAASPSDHPGGKASAGLTVRHTVPTRKHGPRVTYEAAHIDGEYPRVTALFREAVTDAAKPSEVGFTGMSSVHYVTAIEAAASTLSPGEAVTMRNVSQSQSAVYGSPDFLALVMQRRLLGNSPEDSKPRPQLAAATDARAAWLEYLGVPAVSS